MRKYAGTLAAILLIVACALWAGERAYKPRANQMTGVITKLRIYGRGVNFWLNGNRYYTDDSDPGLNIVLLYAGAKEQKVTIGVSELSDVIPLPGDEGLDEARRVTSCRGAVTGELADVLPAVHFELIRFCAPLMLPSAIAA